MKKLAALFLCAACGGAAPVTRPVTLPRSPASHVPTEAERRDAVCAKSELASLGAPVVASAAKTTDSAAVLDVAVRDAADHAQEVRAETLAPVSPGAPFDEAAAREATRRLWKTGRFADVAVETIPDRGGVHVVFRVTPKPTIARVFVAGDASEEDVAALRLTPSVPYDPVAIVTARRDLRASLASKGLLDAEATISSAFASADRSSVDVCVRVRRGPRVVIESIHAHGSAFDADLDAVLAHDDAENVPGAVPNQDYLERDALLLAAALYDRGLIEHKLETKSERHGDAVRITFEIADGRVFHYGKLDVRGQLVAPKSDYMKLLVAFKRGAVFDRTELVKALDAIRALDTSRGRPDLEVEPTTELDPKTGTVAIVVQVSGPPGFSVVDLKRGTGRVAASGGTANVEYKGTLLDGTVFDTNVGGQPFTFHLGGGQVIQGFDRGVLGMKVGGKRRVTIPPDLGYGKSGAPPKIPPNSTLVFEIELLAIQ